MRKLFSVGAIVGVLVLTHAIAAHAQVVDQSNYGAYGPFGSAYSWQGQTFKPTATTSAGAGFLFNTSGTESGTVTIQLWSALASTPGATMLASGSTAYSITGTSMLDVFWSAVGVTPGTEYFLAVNAGNSQLISLYSANTYADGQAHYNYDSVDPTSPYTCCGGSYDLGFEEFATSAVVATPEPASTALIATGLIGVFGAVRRRRKNA